MSKDSAWVKIAHGETTHECTTGIPNSNLRYTLAAGTPVVQMESRAVRGELLRAWRVPAHVFDRNSIMHFAATYHGLDVPASVVRREE